MLLNNITVTPDILSLDECNDIVTRLNPKETGADMHYFDNVNRNYNIKKLECKKDPLVLTVLNRIGIDIEFLHSAQLLYYPTNAHNGVHADNCVINQDGTITRHKPWTHTGIVFINDDYVGGELVFTQHNVTLKCKAGTYVVTPSDENYLHKVNRVMQGIRYSLVLRFILP